MNSVTHGLPVVTHPRAAKYHFQTGDVMEAKLAWRESDREGGQVPSGSSFSRANPRTQTPTPPPTLCAMSPGETEATQTRGGHHRNPHQLYSHRLNK
jgi:hypothetical protein